MNIASLFSGGKDSCLATYRAQRYHDVVCLISLVPKSVESRIFHFPNVWVTKIQAESMGLPLIQIETGDDEKRGLADLNRSLKLAIKKFGIEGVVAGIIRSTYQASRIQRLCDKMNLWCFNPLWLMDSEELLSEVLREGFKAIISGVFAYPLNESFLGKTISPSLARKLLDLGEKYGFNAAGEGGEIETTVLDGPIFRKRIEVTDYEVQSRGNSGIFMIRGLRLIDK
jgi:ABC transporter with metal-binding/Fe-S-binding domain ATP-binding protein